MTSCEKTWQFKSLLFDSVLIENQFFYYMQNLVLETKTKFNFEWINERIELISECEVNMTKF